MLRNRLLPYPKIILTGGPGSGKTSIIEELRSRGFQCIDEVGRKIIQEQLEMGGDALHWGDQIKFRDLMLSRSVEDYLSVEETKKPVFFDRGIPELIGYSYLINQPVSEECKLAAEKYRYHQNVFIAPPWLEIYQNDAERKQDFQEAIATYEAVKKSYIECGYNVIELPKVDVDGRVTFILEHLAQKLP